jgi:hypothetical protein
MDIHQLVAAINPDVFCQPQARAAVKKQLRDAIAAGDRLAYLKAAENAQPLEPNQIALDHLEDENPFRLPGFRSPTEQHTLVYDSFDESLEAFYFWLLDELTSDGWDVSKLADTFLATPGSGLFAELTRRESRAQQEASRMLREAHALVRDILRTASFLKTESKFNDEYMEDQLSPQIEQGLLRSKIESLKLYARWLGPYLKQARELAQNTKGSASLVNLFNSTVAEVTLLVLREYPVNEDVDRGDLPRFLLKARRRDVYSVLLLEFKFRAAPERTAGGAYGYRGRFELTVTSYALNAGELAVLRQALDQDNLDATMQALAGDSGKAIAELVKQVENLVTEPPKETEPNPEDSNPFASLFAFKNTFGSQNQKAETGGKTLQPLVPDTEIEQVIRSQAILDARRRCLRLYNRCKLVLKMPVMDDQ